MKSLSIVPLTATPVPLHAFIDQLMTGLLPLAVNKNTLIVNDVDKAFTLQADEDALALILGSLMSTVVSNTENTCIRINALFNQHCIQINLNHKGYCNSTIAQRLNRLVKIAQQMGGSISIQQNDTPGATASLSFALAPMASC